MYIDQVPLAHIAAGLKTKLLAGSLSTNVSELCTDSRRSTKGSLFFCLPGRRVDGHDFIAEAIRRGAVAVVVQDSIRQLPPGVTCIQVENMQSAVSHMSNRFFGEPSKSLNIIGVTGTNGKTSVTHFLGAILNAVGQSVAIIGSLGWFVQEDLGRRSELVDDPPSNTPATVELHRILRSLLSHRVQHVALEVTSMALDCHRVDHVKFRVGVLTNLTPDHLDYHGSMDAYRQAKCHLFQLSEFSVINADDPNASFFSSCARGRVITYGIEVAADVTAREIIYTGSGVRFLLKFGSNEAHVSVPIPGKATVENALAAVSAALMIDLSWHDIVRGVAQIQPVPGRFERVGSTGGVQVFVDYAHSPDALEKLLISARMFTIGRLLLVFGCGGDRDPGKRAMMGKVAGRLADECYVTSDNPRSEDPSAIAEAIVGGMESDSCPHRIILDRRVAILTAFENAKETDVVLVAGKGHEAYQELRDGRIPFSDRDIIRQELERMKRLSNT